MEFEELKDYIWKKLYEKGINIETQDYITLYVYMNQKLFNGVLKPKEIADRIIDNLSGSIKTLDYLLFIKEKKEPPAGSWMPFVGEIRIDPVIKILSSFSSVKEKEQLSTIMHELDHCATTSKRCISQGEKYYMINEYEKDDNKGRVWSGMLVDMMEHSGYNWIVHCWGIEDDPRVEISHYRFRLKGIE